jgi:hypothetical protein
MKRAYDGLMAEKVDFGKYDLATNGSLPSSCIQIVADTVDPGANQCKNPSDTTQYMYVGDDPYAGVTYDDSMGC